MYKAYHQNTIRVEVITGERNSLYDTNIKNNFLHLIYTGQSCVIFFFCCDNRSPDGRHVQAGLNDQMVYQRHGQIPFISCMWSLVQSARPLLISNIFCGLGLILIFQADLVSGYKECSSNEETGF
jgi:hypothetical protein